ncbi:hypothetical protein J844_4062 [Acinetobacter baumannii 24975_1]|nr:hypothetical protein J844_4062 [Acinetobacter baumannii 24975_1]
MTATDAAGNVGNDTAVVTIDTSLPVVSLDDLTTNDTTPALTGAIDDPTATVVVNVDGIDYPATNNGDGTWTLADNTLPALIDGPHTVAEAVMQLVILLQMQLRLLLIQFLQT